MLHRNAFLAAFAALATGCFTDTTPPSGGLTESDATSGGDESSTSESPDFGDGDGEEDDSTDTTGGGLPDPVAWYRFDGSLFDASGNDYDAEDPTESATFEDAPSGMALRLASGGYLRAPGVGASLAQSEQLTVVVSLRLEVDSTQDVVFALGDGSSEDPSENLTLMHFFEARAWLLTETADGENNSHDLAASPGIGEWITVAWVLDGAEVRYFEDGEERGALPYVSAASSPPDVFVGGGLAHETLDGLIDEMAVYDVALEDPRLPD